MAQKGKSHISVGLGEAVGIINEAIRIIEAYTYDAKREPKALLDIEKDTANNRTLILNEKLLHKHTGGKTIRGLREIYKDISGRDPAKNATIRATILTMPINEIKGLDFGLTKAEAVALEKYNNEEALEVGDQTLLESAKEKLIHLEYTPEQLEQIYAYFEKVIDAICKVNGVKRSDVLYAVVHCNGESSPHLHLGFVPAVYIKDRTEYDAYQAAVKERNEKKAKAIANGMSCEEATAKVPLIKRPKTIDGDTNRVVAEGEKALGSSANRFNKPFLKYYLDNIQKAMAEPTYEYDEQGNQELDEKGEPKVLREGIKTQLRNGHGHTFDVDKKSHTERKEEKFEARIAEAVKILKEQSVELENSNAEAAQALKTVLNQYETAQKELTTAIFEKESAESEAAKATAEKETAIVKTRLANQEKETALAEVRAIEEEKDEILGELGTRELVLTEQIKEHQNFIKKFKSFLETLADRAVEYVIEKFKPKWKKAKTEEEKGLVDEEVTKSLADVVRNEVKEFQEQNVQAVAEAPVIGVTSFDRENIIQRRTAFSQIKKALVGTSYEGDVKYLTPQVKDHPLMERCLDIWFDEERERKAFAKAAEDEKATFMRPPQRAERFKVEFDRLCKAGELDNVYEESEIDRSERE